ncbi:MAG: DUF2513 domain-containing protein [Chloroflexi bacterium]|nr:DUF2513 domain-containing protein [Chloroflexota bacterium]
MKRDMNLIRLLLLKVEGVEELDLTEYTSDEIGYHSYLLLEAGLASGADVSGSGMKYPEAILELLTWEGHDFLDAARNESVWKKAMGKLSVSGGSFTFDIVKALLIATMKDQLGI